MRVIIGDEGRARWLAGGLELMFGVLVRMRPLIMRVLTQDAGQGLSETDNMFCVNATVGQ
jgi:hypothetical protein